MNKFKQESTRFLVAELQGPRDEQQDMGCYFSADQHRTALLVVSDGVGGNSGGRLASETVAEVARQLWEKRSGQFDDPWAELDALCKMAHERMNDQGAKKGLSPRATIAALYLTPTKAFWVHSGDSRLYHFQSGRLIKRTEDHSVLQVMVTRGMVSEDKMGEHPDQGSLLQSLGGENYKEPARDMADISGADAFLLCTDGFWERTKVEEMADMLFSRRERVATLLPQAVERAVKRNGPDGDNVTVVVALPETEGTGGANRRRNGAVIPFVVSLCSLLALGVLWSSLGGWMNSRPAQTADAPTPTAGSSPSVLANPPPTDTGSRPESSETPTPTPTDSPLQIGPSDQAIPDNGSQPVTPSDRNPPAGSPTHKAGAKRHREMSEMTVILARLRQVFAFFRGDSYSTPADRNPPSTPPPHKTGARRHRDRHEGVAELVARIRRIFFF